MIIMISLRKLPLLLLALAAIFVARLGPASQASSFEPSFATKLTGGDDEIIKEFKKYFKKYKDTPTRVEAVLALEGEENPAVVKALVPVLRDEVSDVRNAAIRVLGGFKTSRPIKAMMLHFEETNDDMERLGILGAVAVGGYSLSPENFYQALSDKNWEVRRIGIKALVAAAKSAPENRVVLVDPDEKPKRRPRDWPASPEAAVAPLCTDKEVAVRCAAIEGLADMNSELAVLPSIAALEDPVWQVRVSAIDALKRVRRQESIGPLVARMQIEEGRLITDIGVALAELTGRNYGQRKEGWKSFWDTFSARFSMPTDQAIADLKAAKKLSAESYTPAGSVNYHGISTPSRSILFVIDVSGSMENLVIEKERFEDGDYPSFSRIDIVKTELARTIEGLEPYVTFNILSFATETDPWKSGLVKANVLNKSSAMDWTMNLVALGGASNADVAGAGLIGAAGLSAGKTNTYGALMWALGAAGGGLRDKEYEVAVDTIFFLSDGRPSTGEFVDTEDILREVLKANELRKVVLHTIAIGEFQKGFMRQMAEKSGGVFVDLGR